MKKVIIIVIGLIIGYPILSFSSEENVNAPSKQAVQEFKNLGSGFGIFSSQEMDTVAAFARWTENASQFAANRLVEKYGALSDSGRERVFQNSFMPVLSGSEDMLNRFNNQILNTFSWNGGGGRVLSNIMQLGGGITAAIAPDPFVRAGGALTNLFGTKSGAWCNVNGLASGDLLGRVRQIDTFKPIGGVSIGFAADVEDFYRKLNKDRGRTP